MDADIAVLKFRADQADLRMGRIEDKLDGIAAAIGGVSVQLATVAAGTATKDTLRNWGIGATVTIVATVVASALAVAALLGTMQGNTLSAFQAGISASGMVGAREAPATAVQPPSAAVPTPASPPARQP